MAALSNISSVAKYESKLLMRSWFYRIFLVLSILFLCFFNLANLVFPDSPRYWIMRALPSNIAYINLLLLNVGQAVIAVFLSSEFLKSDKKLDTSEVFYVHPLSNAEYVAGKIWGNLNVFIRLNLLIIGLVIIFNFISGVTIDWGAYVTYFFLICVPTLIFIFGLSVGLMLILKSQAITFVVLLGYIALTLFYISDKFYFLFDYMAYSLPLVKSSIIGFSNWSTVVNHRLIYLLLGLGFLCISIFLFRRLPNTKYGRYRWLALACFLILAGVFAGYRHVSTIFRASDIRAKYVEINNKYVNSPQMVIENYDITVEQHPQKISASVVMHGTAQESSDVFTFCLNPSLEVIGIKENDNDLAFTRDHQIILIDFGRVLEREDTVTWTVTYAGTIDENFCYLDIPADLLHEKYSVEDMFNVDKKYSFQADNYVLFTPETYWYPRPGVAYSDINPDWQRAYFSDYRLEVKTINGLTALSQGTRLSPREKMPTIRSNEFDSNDFYGMMQMGGMRGGGGPMFFGGGGMGGFGGFGGFGGGQRGGGPVQVQSVARGQQGQGGQGGQGQGGNTRGQQGQGGGDFRGQQGQGQGGGDFRGQQGQGQGGNNRGQGGDFRGQQGQGGDFRGQQGQGGDFRGQQGQGQGGNNRGQGGDFRAQQGQGGGDFRGQQGQGQGGNNRRQGGDVGQQGQGQGGNTRGQGQQGQGGGDFRGQQGQGQQGQGGQGGNTRGQGGQGGDFRAQQGQGGGDFRGQQGQGQGGNNRRQGGDVGQQGQGGGDFRAQRPAGDGEFRGRMREGTDSLARMRDGGGDFRAQGPEGDEFRARMRDSMMTRMREGGAQGPEGDEFRARMRDSMMTRMRDGGGEFRGQREGGGEFRGQGPEGGEFRGRMRIDGDSTGRFRDEIADAETVRDSIFIFKTDFPTPAISLIIGDYEQKCVEVDRTLFNLWYLKGNDFFTASYDSIADTIPSQIRIRRQTFESNYSLNYSFKRFSLVEVPVQFRSYVRAWSQAQETLQPEMVLFPEKGCIFNNADVKRQITLQKTWSKRQGMELSDMDAALRVFNMFMMTFQNAESRGQMTQERGQMTITTVPNPYFLFPQLYNFRYNIFSSDWAIANRLIELYLQDRGDNNRMRQMNGISDFEKANLLIQKRPFKELLIDPEQRDLLNSIISLKANVLFAPAELNVGYTEFRDSLRAYLNKNRFTNLRFEDLLSEMSLIAGENLLAPIASWDTPTKLPVYIVGTPDITYIINRDVEVYVVKLQVTNDSEYDGIINFETVFGGGGGGGFGGFGAVSTLNDPRAKRKISLAAGETKLLVNVWDEAPRELRVSTLISANLPNLINMPVNNIITERNITIDKEGDFVLANVNYNLPGEVIVDNEDFHLFEISQPDIVGLLPKWLEDVGDNSFPYQGVTPFRPPLQWTLTTNDKYYGTHIRSAYVIKSGSGSQNAIWKVPVPEKGTYDLYYYVYMPDELRRTQNNRGGMQQNNNRGPVGNMEYHFKVRYDDGEDNAYINLRRANEGWARVGTFGFYNDDTIKVVLSNDIANIRMVTADAVKIVKRETSIEREIRTENPEFARTE